jgi:hypothetical protein
MNSFQSPAYLNVLRQVSLFDINIQQLFENYHEDYLNDEAAQLFVKTSMRLPDDLRCHPYIGLSDRSIGKGIAKARTLEGGEIRGSLKQAKLFSPTSGHETFRGCVVFPVITEHNKIIAATGYRYGQRIRKGQQAIIHWDRPEADDYIKQGIASIKEIMYEKTYH